MLQRQVKSFLTNTVLRLSSTKHISGGKSEILFFAWETAVAWRKCVLLACYRLPCFLLCWVPKGNLSSMVARCQPTAGKVLLLQSCSRNPERDLGLHCIQTFSPDLQWRSSCRSLPASDRGCCHILVTLVKNACVHMIHALLQLLNKVQQWALCTQGTWAEVSDFALKWIENMPEIQSGSVTELVMPRKAGGTSDSCITPGFQSCLASWKNWLVGKGRP